MIVKLSEMLLKFVLKNIRIEKEMIDIYRYGIELLVSTLTNLALITIIGILINDIVCSLVFLLGFIPILSADRHRLIWKTKSDSARLSWKSHFERKGN